MPNTVDICGSFPEPENPDKGQTSPYRVKVDGEAPTVPAIHPVSYEPNVSDPDIIPPFTKQA